MKLVKCLVVVAVSLTSFLSVTAQVKIGSNPTVINSNTILELEADNKGLLLPRVALTSTDSASPLTAFVRGIFIYNTASSGAGTTAVSPGVYYSDGLRWVRLENNSPFSSFWSLNGNSGTNPATNFLGTTDNKPLIFKTNNVEALRVLSDGKIGVNTANPTTALDVNGELKVRTVNSGGVGDSILVVGNTDQVVKRISGDSYLKNMQKQLDVVATNGQQLFNTPSNIIDEKKILLYRNGVMIGFTVVGAKTIKAEIAAYSGDEIRIVQLL
ncbi:hypothetical protein [Nubsella zeaxanthinifaciens]|uniref:hypothetical protein n=1 Tax=Nubsella zeaxanthinifaciens TaxID=392412 RepID=UPI000DE35C8C|nr:hypothetical protein [Nubsella zeaxanthinifaciens]